MSFDHKKASKEFKKQINCLVENTENWITITVPIKKKLKELINMEQELQKLDLTHYRLLIAQDLWQPHNQILSIMFLKQFIKLNVNSDTIIKIMKHAELNISIATVFLNTQTLKMT